jgi:hypothetical protein
MNAELERIWKEAGRGVTEQLSVHFLRTEDKNEKKKSSVQIGGIPAAIRTAHLPNLLVTCFLFRLV